MPKVYVPATTANLGPGFDCLGAALDIWNCVEFQYTGNGVNIINTGEGAEEIATTPENLIYQAFCFYFISQNLPLPPGVTIITRNNIPLGSGLGSSSAAIAAGVIGAALAHGETPDVSSLLDCALQLEGHPDNLAPCFLGGMIAAFIEDGHVVGYKIPVSALNLVAVHPHYHFPTSIARAALPQTVSMTDAIYNTSHALLLAEAFRTGNIQLLSKAMSDRLHQPYRLKCIPGAEAAFAAAKANGAAAVVLSGAGPSLLAVTEHAGQRQAVADAMLAAFSQAGLSARAYFPAISSHGAYWQTD